MGRPDDDTRTRAALWLAGALLLAFDAWLVSLPPLDVPYLRELYFVGVASGREALSWEFIHRPTLEHVMPLPMALGALAVRLSGVAGANRVLNLVVLAAVAWLLVRAAKQIRGRVALADVALPLVALSPMHVFSFVSGFNLQLVLSAALYSAAIAAALVSASALERRWLFGGALATACLPLTGVSGVLSLAFAGPALAAVAWRHRGELTPKARAALALILAGSVALGLRYFPWSRLSEHHQAVVSPLRLTAELFAAALGATGSRLFPASFLLVLGLAVAPLVLLARRKDRLGLLVVGLGLGGQLVIALGIGYGRAHYDNALSFSERYVELAAPWLLLAHLGLVGAGARRALAASSAIAALSAAANAPLAVARIHEAEEGLRAFSGDARAGLTLSALAERHGPFLYPFDRGVLLSGLSTLMLEPRPPFDQSPTGGLVSVESHELPCASELVSWVKLRGPAQGFAFAPERAVDGHAPSEWRPPAGQAAALELVLGEARPLALVCVMPGQRRSAEGRLRVEAWSEGQLVAQVVGALPREPAFAVLPLSAARVDRVKVHVLPGESLAELRFASP